MAAFNSEHKTVLDELLLGHSHVRSGKMFGFPAYYVDKKLCICLYEQGVGIKLPETSVAKLLATDRNACLFQPMGKPKPSAPSDRHGRGRSSRRAAAQSLLNNSACQASGQPAS